MPNLFTSMNDSALGAEDDNNSNYTTITTANLIIIVVFVVVVILDHPNNLHHGHSIPIHQLQGHCKCEYYTPSVLYALPSILRKAIVLQYTITITDSH